MKFLDDSVWFCVEELRKHIFSNSLFSKNVVFALQTAFFDGFNVLLSFLAEK